MRTLISIRWFIAVSAVLSSLAASDVQRFPIRLVEGLPVSQVNIIYGENKIVANVLIELGRDFSFAVHSDLVEVLALAADSRISIEYDGGSFTGVRAVSANIDWIDNFTKNHALELNEVPIWGIIGAGIFESDSLSLDIQDGEILFGDIDDGGGDRIDLELVNGSYVVGIAPLENYILKAAISTINYQCVVDSDCAAISGYENGDFERLILGNTNIREYSPVRAIDGMSDESGFIDSYIGNSFWQNFTVHINLGENRLSIHRKDGRILTDLKDQEYFNAFASGGTEKIERCIKEHPSSRYFGEACKLLLKDAIEKEDNKRINDFAVMLAATAAGNPNSILFEYATNLAKSKQYTAGSIILQVLRDKLVAENQDALLRARVDAYLGFIYLEEDNRQQARRALLNSLFANSHDSFTNYLMGRYYLGEGQNVRAFARFIRSSLSDRPFEDAAHSLRQLGNNEEFTSSFSIEEAAEFLDGWVLDENGNLTEQAMRLKRLGGEFISSAIDAVIDGLGEGDGE